MKKFYPHSINPKVPHSIGLFRKIDKGLPNKLTLLPIIAGPLVLSNLPVKEYEEVLNNKFPGPSINRSSHDLAIYRGQDLVNKGYLDKNIKDLFEEIENLPIEEFIKVSYDKLSKSMGILNPPPLEIVEREPYRAGSYRVRNSCILINKNCEGGKRRILECIRHELEHFMQYLLIYSVFGKERLEELILNRGLKIAPLSRPCSIEIFGKPFVDLSKEEIENWKAKEKEKMDFTYYEKNKHLYKTVTKNSEQYKKALLYAEGEKNYIHTALLRYETDLVVREYLLSQYENNLSEVYANKAKDKIHRLYEYHQAMMSSQ